MSASVADQYEDALDTEPNADAPSDHSFNTTRLFEAFSKCLRKREGTNDYEVNLKEYLHAYEEISKFLHCLGTVFMFVTSDINDKIHILEGYLRDSPDHYRTVQSLVEHEHANQMLQKPQSSTRKNASRHFLRLHRALLFIYKFLNRLYTAEANAKSPAICIEVYDATLSKHHSFLVRQAARIGMYTLPRREALIELMVSKERHDDAKFHVFIQTVERVYSISQGVYEKYQILELP
jgi:hypothetical protein